MTINPNKWQLLLTFVDNGMVLENPNHVYGKDDDRGGRFEEVIEQQEDEDEDDSLSNAKLVKKLMYSIIEYFGLHSATNKHSKYNIDIKIKGRAV